MKKLIISLIVVMVVIAGGWYLLSKNVDSVVEPVVTVNGESISRSDLELVQSRIINEQGLDVLVLDNEALAQLQTQALDILISQTLLRQAAERFGVKVSKTDIDARVETVKGQFESEALFASAMVSEGLTEKSLRTNIENELNIQIYLNQALSFDSLTVTEEEIGATYEAAIQGVEDVPALDEARGQIEGLVISQKQQSLVTQHVQTLRTEAQIEILI